MEQNTLSPTALTIHESLGTEAPPLQAGIDPSLGDGSDSETRLMCGRASRAQSLPVQRSTFDVQCSTFTPAPPLQPVLNLRDYLSTRRPVPHYSAEESLFSSLPTNVKSNLRLLLGVRPGSGAFSYIQAQVKAGLSVAKSVTEARLIFKLPGSLARLRERYDLWSKSRDWVCLVNRSKAGADWQDRDEGLPDIFLEFCATRMGAFAREDGKRQALLSIHRQWTTGRNEAGQRQPIPGYGDRPCRLNGRMVSGGYWQDWFQAVGYRVLAMSRRPLPLECPGEPTGWSETNIRKQIKARNLFGKSVQALLHEGPAAARTYLPQVKFDRNTGSAVNPGGPLLFLERVEFDDVKVDFRVIDPVSGQECDLWLLIARDRGTNILLGFGMRPAKTRDDGTQEHLRLRDMKQLCGWILERYGLPPYLMIWVLEHGTATLPPAVKRALRELLPGSIDINYSSMIGGSSPTGYQQRAVGNSKGKASLESTNRLGHTMLSFVPGQTGPLYTRRPADLAARGTEAVEIWQTTQHLPEHLRRQVGYPVLTIEQAREHLFRCFQLQNERTKHELQGFEQVVELWDGQRWVNQALINTPLQRGANSAVCGETVSTVSPRVRMESPLERCARLVAPYRNQWRQISPDIITAFYEHTIRQVIVKPNGLITDRGIEFMPPLDAPDASRSTLYALAPGTKCLAYCHPDDPTFMHLTDGRGRILGTWLRRSRAHDHDTLQAAIRYSQSALTAAKETAAHYATAETERLETMRATNAELLASNDFVEVAVPVKSPISNLQSPVAMGLATIPRARRQAEDTQANDEALAESLDRL